MPDMQMCKNEDCPKKNKCFRYIAEPNKHWQAYGKYDHDNCQSFIDIDELRRSEL